MKKFIAPIVCVVFTLTAPFSQAQSDRDAEIAELKAELQALSARLDALERRDQGSAQVVEVEPSPAPAPAGLPERIRLSGDLRYRHETINDAAAVERNRHRIRARIGLTADVTDDVTVGLRLSSGGDDPVSGNQTLGDGASRKSIGIDRAFFDWNVTDNLAVSGGKMGNPFFRPGSNFLVFDGDLNPEGLALSYETGSFFGNFAGFAVEERSSADDALMIGGQAGFDGTVGQGVGLVAGVSLYNYRRTRGWTPFYDGEGNGNTLDAQGNYANDFDEVEIFAQASFDVGGQPLRLFADYVENTAADTLNRGYALGAQWRSASAPGTWDIGWAYEDLEADAVVATFTDSDFAGGGTDGKGHVFRTNYVFRDRWNLGLTYFLNKRGAAAGNERNYKRLQADVSFRY